jgi:hypothetical protein
MKQLHVFGAWQHNWKLWGQNHNIYSHYTSTTIYTLCTYKGFVALPVKFNGHLLPVIQFWVLHFKNCPIQSLTSHFLQYVLVHFFTVFPVWSLLFCAHKRVERWDFSSSIACVTGILCINCSLPTNLLAGLLVWPWAWTFRTASTTSPSATFS